MHGDAIRLRQVLGNLVNNAVKFTEAGAVLLAVTVAPSSGDELVLEFSVTDTGVGVAVDEQAAWRSAASRDAAAASRS